MSPSNPEFLIVLPPREDFSPEAAGAISLVVRRHCEVTPHVAVAGSRRAATFPGVPYVPVANAWGVWRAVRRLRPRVVEVHQQPRLALALALLCPGARVLLFLHNDPLTMRGLRTRFGRRLAVRFLHRVICVSDYLRQRFLTLLGAVEVAVLPNPLSGSEMPAPASVRDKKILFVGRVTDQKAPDIFVAAWALAAPALPGWEAEMIGGDRFGPASPETDYVARMRAAARSSGVAFLGPRPHREVLAAMAAAAIVAVPSRWAEPFGLTALEAMASGAALITTGQGGLREVAGEAALYVPPDDAPALAAAMVRLATDEVRRSRLARAGLERAQDFETARVGAELARLRG